MRSNIRGILERLIGTFRRLTRDYGAMLGLIIILSITLVAIFADLSAPYDPIKHNLSLARSPPNREHLLGCDELGRDLLSRIMFGARSTLISAVLSIIVSVSIGVFFGLLAGYYGGIINTIIMRLTDMLLAFPYLLLTILIVAVLGPSTTSSIIAISVSSIAVYIRLTQGAVLSIKEKEFIRATIALGARDGRVIFKHILPNILAPIVSLSTVRIGRAILALASLSFVGLGAPPPTPEWGAMINAGREYLGSPHLTVFPGFAIMITVIGFRLLGEGLERITTS